MTSPLKPADTNRPKNIQRLKRESASSQLHNALRERVISLELKPGQYLSRSEISEAYGVSQTPVRDALLKLEEEGLIVTYPQSKTEVSKINVEHALETQFLRLSIELEITRRLAQAADRGVIDKISHILKAQDLAFRSGDLDTFARLDHEFHLSLYIAAGVQNLHNVIDARSGHIDRLRNLNLPDPGKSRSILDWHNRIFEAIKAGDAAETEHAVREHLSGTLAKVEQIRAEHPDYF